MKNFENVRLSQDKFGLHQTCTIYSGVIALSIVCLVGFLKQSYEELLRKNVEPDFRVLAPRSFVWTGQAYFDDGKTMNVIDSAGDYFPDKLEE